MILIGKEGLMETKYTYWVKYKGIPNYTQVSENTYNIYCRNKLVWEEHCVEMIQIVLIVESEESVGFSNTQEPAFHFLLGKIIGSHLTETKINVKELTKELIEHYNIDVTKIIEGYFK
jgi:hypothetical protein